MASNNAVGFELSDDSSELLDSVLYGQSESTNEASLSSSQISLEDTLFSDPILEPYCRHYLRDCKASKDSETLADSFSTLEQDSEETVSLNSDSSVHVDHEKLAPSQSTETIDSITSSEISLEQSCSLSEDVTENKTEAESFEEACLRRLVHEENHVDTETDFPQETAVESSEISKAEETKEKLASVNTDFCDTLENRGKDHNENPTQYSEETNENVLPLPPMEELKETTSAENLEETNANTPVDSDGSLSNRVDCREIFVDSSSSKLATRKTTIHPLLEDYPVSFEETATDVVAPLETASTGIGAIKKRSKTDTDSRSRRVSFPEDDTSLITSYLEPVDPWNKMSGVTQDEISEAYKASCERHRTMPLPVVLQQIAALPLSVGGRVECLNLKGQKLDTSQCECLEEIFRRVQFKSLNFEGCDLDDDSVIILFDMIEFYDSGIHLNIACNENISERGWHACARLLKRSPSIDLMNAHSTTLSEQAMFVLARTLRLGTRLTCLHLENCNLTGRSMVVLVGALRQNDLLKELYLADNQLGVTDSIQIENLLCTNRSIQLLDLRNNNIQDSGCSHVCIGVSAQSKDTETTSALRTLVLWNNHLTIQSVSSINLLLQSTKHLQTLNLGKNKLGAEGILQMKNSLIRNRTLLRLGLQDTRITNEGAVALAEYIADNVVVERIDLRENNIQVAGLMALAQSIRINKTIIKIDLDMKAKCEPSPELEAQHSMLFEDIKEACQRNLTDVHRRRENVKLKESTDAPSQSRPIFTESRKVSLTCESLRPINKWNDGRDENDSEPKRYRSPAPSPSISPCPSPSPSVFAGTGSSRFKVFKVSEPCSLPTSQSTDLSALSTSAPAAFSVLSSSISPRPNRFTGGRFTVTKVAERSSRSLPCLSSRTMSSPSLNLPDVLESDKPVIVVSSPSNPIAGFGTDSSPSDDVFEPPNTPTNPILESHTLLTNSLPDLSSAIPNISPVGIQDLISSVQKDLQKDVEPTALDPTAKAPLASIEGSSFETDSEDSEPTPQSSDSTHSDEVRLASEASSSTWTENQFDASTNPLSVQVQQQ